jgi:phage terminase large subunit GpA-like protein
LDCRNYALAAFKALSPDLDAIDRRLKAAETERKQNAPQYTKQKPGKKKNKTAHNKYFDDW